MKLFVQLLNDVLLKMINYLPNKLTPDGAGIFTFGDMSHSL